MRRIKDASGEINNFKISISKAVVIYVLNKLDSHFRLYLAILSYNVRGKEKLSILSELTKTLEDEQMRLSNKNRGTAKYARSLKPKKAKASEQKKKKGTENGFDIKGNKKRQEVKECKIYGGKHHGTLWALEDTMFYLS